MPVVLVLYSSKFGNDNNTVAGRDPALPGMNEPLKY